MTAYHPDVVPFDKTDFVGTHVTLCIENKKVFTPIFTYKTISYDRCLKHVIEFPGLSLMKSDGDPSCVAKIETILLENHLYPHHVVFDSGWAQDVHVRFAKDAALKNALREIFIGCVVLQHQENDNTEVLGCGGKKVKTNLVLESMGFVPLGEHSTFFQSSLFGCEAVFFHCNQFSPFALACAVKAKQMWQEKLLIDGRKSSVRNAA